MISLIISLIIIAVIIIGIVGFIKKIKLLQFVFLDCVLLFALVISYVFYNERTQHGSVFICDSLDSPIKSCTYISDAKYHYDSMDGAYYLEEAGYGDVKFSFKADDCMLRNNATKTGACKDVSSRDWVLVLSGGRP